MAETLITELSKIAALRVISRQSVMQFKGTKLSLPEIARKLNVDAVVEGSALLIGERVRITVQLIEAATDVHLWAIATTATLATCWRYTARSHAPSHAKSILQ